MGEPSCYNILSPLGGCSGFQSDLVVIANPIAGSPPHPNCFSIAFDDPYSSWVSGLPIKPYGFFTNPLSGSSKHPRL
jgi:hypothetical protein